MGATMQLLIQILAIYLIYGIGMSVVICRHGMKDRGLFVFAAWIMPFTLVASIFHSAFLLLFRRSPRVRRCPDGLADAERIVERYRLEMFGGKPVEHRFAADWARLYAMTLETETEQVQRFARRVLTSA